MLDFSPTDVTNSSLEPTELEDLLNYFSQVHQVDLTGYKRSTLMRRTLVRMQRVGVKHYQGYLDYLQQQPDEVTHLLNTLFINFTYFFRDSLVWDYLADQVIPQIIANKAPNEAIRVWSAGCASGEETYSLAMLLAEALGVEQFQRRVRIYGTDVDRDAILQARRGHYSAHAVEAIPAALQEQYFERKDDAYCWRQDLRRSIIFYAHNLMQDPPLPHIDLLVCRNTLMYFTLDAQIRALVRFHFGLQQHGFLILGQAENLAIRPQTSLFTPIDRKVRAFTKVPNAHRNNYLLPMAFAPISTKSIRQFT
jgi:chemotaxis methyl-accepting protein methylase